MTGGAACRHQNPLVGSLFCRHTAGAHSAMTIGNHLEAFAGFPVRDYGPDLGVVAGGRVPRRGDPLTAGPANKFWAIEGDGTNHTVQYGRMGTAGQTQTKQFGTPEEAQRVYEK